MVTPQLSARDLTVGYGRTPVVSGIDFEARPGRVHCLLGQNGSGKTTLFKTLLGLLPPLSGEIRIDGRPLAEFGVRDRAERLAYVPQQHAPPFPFSVTEVVLMGRQAKTGLFAGPGETDRARATAVLAHLGVSELANADYSRISGGQRQMVLIARALAQDTGLLVMDEPTASLDYGNQVRIIAEIRRLATEGLAVVFSTHDPDHALAVADDVTLIHDGRILATGEPRALLTPERLQEVYGVPIAVEVMADGTLVCLPRYSAEGTGGV